MYFSLAHFSVARDYSLSTGKLNFPGTPTFSSLITSFPHRTRYTDVRLIALVADTLTQVQCFKGMQQMIVSYQKLVCSKRLQMQRRVTMGLVRELRGDRLAN